MSEIYTLDDLADFMKLGRPYDSGTLVNRVSTELTQLRELLRLKTDQFQHEAEQNAQLRADLAKAEQERDELERGMTGRFNLLNHARLELNQAIKERDTLKAECERLKDRLDKGLLHKCNHCGVELSVSVAKDGSGKSISPCDLRAQLTQAEEARKLCAVQMLALEEERERLAGSAKKLLAALPARHLTCEDFHHPKRDQHSHNEPCPPLARYNAAVAELTAPSRAESSTLPRTYEQGEEEEK